MLLYSQPFPGTFLFPRAPLHITGLSNIVHVSHRFIGVRDKEW